MPKPEPRWGSLPFAEQIAFFKDKVDLPTETWQDLLGSAHDRAFVVAGAMKSDLLADLHAAVLKGIEQGTTLETFRKDFQAIVAKRGWTGWTGEDSPEGVAWRTKTIYGTNLRTSHCPSPALLALCPQCDRARSAPGTCGVARDHLAGGRPLVHQKMAAFRLGLQMQN